MAEKTGSGTRGSTASRRTGLGPAQAARAGCEVLEELLGRPVEGASGVDRDDEGWTVHVDVLEVPRIPDTTSLMATFQVRLDREGELTGYRRTRRYRRGAADQ